MNILKKALPVFLLGSLMVITVVSYAAHAIEQAKESPTGADSNIAVHSFQDDPLKTAVVADKKKIDEERNAIIADERRLKEARKTLNKAQFEELRREINKNIEERRTKIRDIKRDIGLREGSGIGFAPEDRRHRK